MSRSSVLRRIAGVATFTTLFVASGPFLATAHALTNVSHTPGTGAVAGKRPVISATYDEALNTTASAITLTGGAGFTPVTSPKSFSNGDKTITLTLSADLDESHSPYTVTVDNVAAAPGVPLAPTSWTFTVDATAPTFSVAPALTNPVNPGNMASATVTGTATDAHGPITIAVSVDDAGNGATSPVTGNTSVASGTPFSIPVNLSGLSDGTLTATVTATDALGNVVSASPTATKDTTGPVLQSTSPADNATVQPTTVFSATYNEALSNASTVVILNSADNAVNGTASVVNQTITFNATGSFTELGSPYLATVTAKDTNNNQTTSVVHFSIDSHAPSAPTATLVDPVNTVNQDQATVSGTAEPGSLVTISVDDSTVGSPVTGTTTATGLGTYSKDLNLTGLSDGTLTATVTATDAAGNVSLTGTDTALKDATRPTVTIGTFTSPIKPSNQNTVVVSGGAGATEAGATVNVSVDDAANPATSPVTASTTADGTGAYGFSLNVSSLADGTLTATVTAIDSHGNSSNPPTTQTATKDTGLPTAPTVVISPKPINNANKAAITISGMSEPGASIAISVDDTNGATTAVTTTVTANGSGAYTSGALDLSSLSDTTITASAIATDTVGNVGPAGTATTFKDVVTPNAPSVTLADYANSNTLPVEGTAENLSSIALSATDGVHTATGTATTSANGDWSTTLNLTGFNQGVVTVTATATDAAGNTSTTGSDTTTRDTVAPSAPTVTLTDPIVPPVTSVTITGSSSSGGAGATIAGTVDDTDSGTAAIPVTTTANGSGGYTITFDATSLSDGTITATLTATDPAGNTSGSGTDTATKDTTALALSTTSPANGSTVKSPATVTATFNEPLNTSTSTISVADKTAQAIGGATTFSTDHKTVIFTPTVPPSQNGSPYTVTLHATEPVGGDVVNTTFGFTVDNTAPSTPSATMTNPVNVATNGMATVSGVAEPSSTVSVSIDDATPGSPVSGTTTANGTTGAYTKTLNVSSLADGTLTASVVATDTAGNPSSTATATATKDMSAPDAPVVSLADPINPTNVTAVVLHGTAEALSSISYTITTSADSTSVTGTTPTNGSGDWTVTRDLTSVTDGLLTATVTATDGAGNPSTAGTDTATKDASVPAAPTIAMTKPVNAGNVTTVVVSGVAEPGNAVHLSLDDSVVGSPLTKDVTADGTTGEYTWTFDATSLTDGMLTASATQTDAGNNTSSAATDTAAKDVVLPAAPSVTMTSPVNAANVTNVVVSGVAEASSLVHISLDDATVGSPLTHDVSANPSSGAYTWTFDATGLSDSLLTATVTATDAAMNTGSAGTATATKDVVAPIAPTNIAITNPVNVANKAAVSVSGLAESGSTVHVSLDDATVGNPVVTDVTATGGTFTTSLDATLLDDGTLTVTVFATDPAGNAGPSATKDTTKDTLAPAAPTLDALGDVTHQNYTAYTFSGDADPGVTVTIFVNDTDPDTAAVQDSASADGGGAWSKPVDLSSLSDGTLTIQVLAVDDAFNSSSITTDTVVKDVTRAFTIAVDGTPISGESLAFDVTAHLTDDPGSGVDTSFTGTPELDSFDGTFDPGTCGAAVLGVAHCTGTIFGDLGSQALIATSGTGDAFVGGVEMVVVQPTALVYGTPPPTRVGPGVTATFTVVPVAGVTGADISGYDTARRLITTPTGSSTPASSSVITCDAICVVHVSFATRGPNTVKVTDAGTPPLSTPVATVNVPYASSLTLSRSATTVPAGGNVTLTGALRNTTQNLPIAGATVRLYRRSAPSTTYVWFATVTTSSTGAWSRTVAIGRNTSYQARYLGTTTTDAVNSVARTVLASQVVSSTWSLSGRTLTVSGAVNPSGAAGKPALLQMRRADGTWVTIASSPVTSTNRYVIHRALGPGTYTLRIGVPATANNAAGVSATATTTVH